MDSLRNRGTAVVANDVAEDGLTPVLNQQQTLITEGWTEESVAGLRAAVAHHRATLRALCQQLSVAEACIEAENLPSGVRAC